MTRLPVAAFVALVIATVAAFFVVQHLKITTPLVAGTPIPFPGTINPVSGRTCVVRTPRGTLAPVNFKRMAVSFYLLNRADEVDVEMVDAAGDVVATLPGSGRHLGIRKRTPFTWNGRLAGGRVAPDGIYTVRVVLVQQARYYTVSDQSTGRAYTVTVQTAPPRLEVTGVSPASLTAGHRLTIRLRGNDGLRPRIVIYRLTSDGRAVPVKNYAATTTTGTSVWDGTIHGRPAVPGAYLIGLRLTDRTCNQVRFPARVSAAAAPQAVVTIR